MANTFDQELKDALEVTDQQRHAVFDTPKNKHKSVKNPEAVERISVVWAPYMSDKTSYLARILGESVEPDDFHQTFQNLITMTDSSPLVRSFAAKLALVDLHMKNVNTAEVQLANLIKLNSTSGPIDNAKLFFNKQQVRSTLNQSMKAIEKANRGLITDRQKLVVKVLQDYAHASPNARVNFVIQYLAHQAYETLQRVSTVQNSLGHTAGDLTSQAADRLTDFANEPASPTSNARMKLDKFVSELGSMRLTQFNESHPSYLRTVQATNALRTSFNKELAANTKALAAHEKRLTKSVPKSKPNRLTTKPTAFDVYLDTINKANKMIELLEQKRDLVKSSAEVIAVSNELEQWQAMRTALKTALQSNVQDNNSVLFVKDKDPKSIVEILKVMRDTTKNNKQIKDVLHLLAAQLDHPNYKNSDIPHLFAGETNKNMPANWNQLIEQPKEAMQYLRDLFSNKSKPVKTAKVVKTVEANSPDLSIPKLDKVEMPSLNQLVKERDQRNKNALQGTKNNWNTCKAKMDELHVPKAFVNFVKMQFALHQEDLQTFLGDRNKLKDTKFIEAMNHRAHLLTNITLTFEHPEVTPIIAINAIRGLAKSEFNNTPDSPQSAAFKAQLSTFYNSTESIKPAPGTTPGMPKPPTLETPPPLASSTSVPPTPRVSTSGMFARPRAPIPAPVRDASARYDASDLSSDSDISSSYRSDSSSNSSRSSSSTSSNDSSRRDVDQPPPPLEPSPGTRGPGGRK